ncbi:protein-L-isoaspartate O-methyltransferase domain-containing protein 2 [Caerostris darwini]|uniref:Protein-L-isoaspartate O-methyltransferase domain-containing protein 2 n=1 Tax=Caerostris darwini TaxID=1538125 RepID=A0AAV4WG45_9ARAC|nr:protein-L-isoaspartate O-methyltransferase domain-containing protein 2 [Caerostris darwini]
MTRLNVRVEFQITTHSSQFHIFQEFIKMGGSVSAGKTNDELIDHLVEAEFIKTPLIQRVFRAVDRGNYYVPNQKQNAYKDIAWRMGNLHLSAPCVYSVVMESLKLRAGLSFLNLGSGSGYLSTMAGLVLGAYGVNHGIELYSDIVDFAYERLEDFLKNCQAVDEYEFCEPTFMVGNCLTLENNFGQYDRVYCGASCPEEYEQYIKNLVKIGGILIMPLNEKLLKITRVSETKWHTVKVLSVSFAPLVAPDTSKEQCVEQIRLGDICPPSLKQICRSNIRSLLRDHVDIEHPKLKLKQMKKDHKARRQVRRIVIPFYDESDLENSHSESEFEFDSDGHEFTISSRLPSRMSVFLEDFLRRHAELQLLRDMEEQMSHSSSDSDRDDDKDVPMATDADIPSEAAEESTENKAEGSNEGSDNELFSLITVSNVRPSSSSDESSGFTKPPSQSTRSKKKRLLKRKRHDSEKAASTSSGKTSEPKRKVHRSAATVVWKKFVDLKKDKKEEPAPKEDASDDENYTECMVKRIGALPLPSLLLRYLNYKRDNL